MVRKKLLEKKLSGHFVGISIPEPRSECCLSIENALMTSSGITLTGAQGRQGAK